MATSTSANLCIEIRQSLFQASFSLILAVVARRKMMVGSRSLSASEASLRVDGTPAQRQLAAMPRNLLARASGGPFLKEC